MDLQEFRLKSQQSRYRPWLSMMSTKKYFNIMNGINSLDFILTHFEMRCTLWATNCDIDHKYYEP